jgi:hypothetical protein
VSYHVFSELNALGALLKGCCCEKRFTNGQIQYNTMLLCNNQHQCLCKKQYAYGISTTTNLVLSMYLQLGVREFMERSIMDGPYTCRAYIYLAIYVVPLQALQKYKIVKFCSLTIFCCAMQRKLVNDC